MTTVLTWLLVVTTMRLNDNGGTMTSHFGPFYSLESCQRAAEKWAEGQIGSQWYGAYAYCQQQNTLTRKEKK